jgi:hypothetical protein
LIELIGGIGGELHDADRLIGAQIDARWNFNDHGVSASNEQDSENNG